MAEDWFRYRLSISGCGTGSCGRWEKVSGEAVGCGIVGIGNAYRTTGGKGGAMGNIWDEGTEMFRFSVDAIKFTVGAVSVAFGGGLDVVVVTFVVVAVVVIVFSVVGVVFVVVVVGFSVVVIILVVVGVVVFS